MKKTLLTLCTLALAAFAVYADEGEAKYVVVDGSSYLISGDEATLAYGNRELSGEFVIPSEVEYEGKSYPVTAVGDNAFGEEWGFEPNVGITSLTIPPTVVTIGRYAFTRTMITELEIPETVRTISDGAFSSCDSLKSVIVNGGIESFGKHMFSGCSSLESAVLSEGHTVVPTGTFNSCGKLSTVSLPSSLTEIMGGMYGAGSFEECTSLESIDFPVSLNTIGLCAFRSSGLVSVNLPDGLEVLEEGVFSRCEKLKEVKLPLSISYLPPTVFSECSSLESILLPDNIKELRASGWNSGCFVDCKSLKSVDLGKVETLGDYSFSGCSALKQIVLPSSVVTIGDYAFSGCTSVETIEIGKSVDSIGYWSLAGLNSLASITVDGENKYFSTWEGILCNADMTELIIAPKNLTGNITLPSSVKKLGDLIFSDCKAITGLVLNEGLEWIGSGVISGCEGITEIVIPASVTSISNFNSFNGSNLSSFIVKEGNKYYSSYENNLYSADRSEFLRCITCTNDKFVIPEWVTSIGDMAFYGCENLQEIEFPDGLKEIKSLAFVNSGLKEIDLPESMTSIGEWAFGQCYELKAAIIPDSVKTLGYGVFYSCTALEEIKLPAELTEIPEDLCNNARSLTHVSIPESVKKIGNRAFASTNLQTVNAYPMVPPEVQQYGWPFGYDPYDITVYVNPEAMDAYKSADTWKNMNIKPMLVPGYNHALKVECHEDVNNIVVGFTKKPLTGNRHTLTYKIKGVDFNGEIKMAISNSVGEPTKTTYYTVPVTSEWVEVRHKFTGNANTTGIAWYTEGASGTFFLDDVVLVTNGDENLMVNGDMESASDEGSVPGWWCAEAGTISIVDEYDTLSVYTITYDEDIVDDYWIVYSFDGRKLLETSDFSRVQSLAPGLYLINGRKQLIR